MPGQLGLPALPVEEFSSYMGREFQKKRQEAHCSPRGDSRRGVVDFGGELLQARFVERSQRTRRFEDCWPISEGGDVCGL